jgi:hypothetical protein
MNQSMNLHPNNLLSFKDKYKLYYKFHQNLLKEKKKNYQSNQFYHHYNHHNELGIDTSFSHSNPYYPPIFCNEQINIQLPFYNSLLPIYHEFNTQNQYQYTSLSPSSKLFNYH